MSEQFLTCCVFQNKMFNYKIQNVMNSKSRYELAASVCRGKVWLDNTALAPLAECTGNE